MKQGSLSLNIETFELNELFELLRKGSRTFEKHFVDLLASDNHCFFPGFGLN